MPTVGPVAPERVNWQGAYVGAQVGTLQATHDLIFPGRGGALVNLNNIRIDGGLYAGYNWQLPNGLVLGIEGEINRADFRSTGRLQTAGTIAAAYCVCIDTTAAVRGRIGYAWNRTLFYATLGVGAARMSLSYRDPVTMAILHRQQNWRSGWTVGVGVEQALRNNWSLRLDFRHSDHGTRLYAGGFPEQVRSERVRSSELRVGFARRF